MLGAHAADLVQCVRGGERNGASKIHVTRIELGMPHRLGLGVGLGLSIGLGLGLGLVEP